MKQMYLMGYHFFQTIFRSNPSGESCEQCKTENRLDCLTSLGFPPRRNISLSRAFVKRFPLLYLVLKTSLGAALLIAGDYICFGYGLDGHAASLQQFSMQKR
jgi:hypothetical protein